MEADYKRLIDGAYSERNALVAFLAACYPSGIAKTDILGWDKEWHNCVYVDSPEGQLSWHVHDQEMDLFKHLPPYTKPWDGHDTKTKYERLDRLTKRTFILRQMQERMMPDEP